MLWIELSRELVSEGTISQTALAVGDMSTLTDLES